MICFWWAWQDIVNRNQYKNCSAISFWQLTYNFYFGDILLFWIFPSFFLWISQKTRCDLWLKLIVRHMAKWENRFISIGHKKNILDFAIQFVYASLYILYTKMSSGFVFFDIMQFRFQRKSRNAIHREAIVHLPPLVVRHWPWFWFTK